MRLLLYASLIWLSAVTVASAAEQPKVVWMLADLPISHIGEGPYKDQGIRDQQQRFLAANLPNFTHERRIASIARIWHDIEHGDGVCVMGVGHNADRDKIAVFSKRPETLLGHQSVIIKRANRSRYESFLDDKFAIDLERLGKSESLRGGYVSLRNYSPPIMAMIADPSRVGRLEKVTEIPQLIGLLKSDRLDYIFAQPAEAGFYAEAATFNEPLLAFHVKGVEVASSLFVACSNGTIGRSIVAAIDVLLEQDDKWALFTEPDRNWMKTHKAVEYAGPTNPGD